MLVMQHFPAMQIRNKYLDGLVGGFGDSAT